MRWNVFMAAFVGVGLGFMLASQANAASCVWQNSASGDWADATKWSCGVVPGATDDVSIGNFGTINLTYTASISSLNMTGSTVSGVGAISVTNLATINANFNATINTNGSRFPQLLAVTNGSAIVSITDPALSANSFNAITISKPLGANGTVVLDVGARSVPRLTIQSGSLTAQNDLTVTEVFSMAGAYLSSNNLSAKITLGSSAVMTISDGAYINMPIINDGQITWIGTQSVIGGSNFSWLNRGTLHIRASGASLIFGKANRPFTNHGILRINSTSGVNFDWDVVNYGLLELNSGVMGMSFGNLNQYAGHIRLNGGSLAGAINCCDLDNSPVYLYGGQLSGSSVITGGIENRGGTVELDGALTVTKLYLQSITGTLQVTVTGATNFGRLLVLKRPDKVIGGRIQIDGTLIVNKANGYSPASGDRFQIITGLTTLGEFQQSTGNLTPAFGGYVGAGVVIVAELDNAALAQAKPDNPNGERGAENGYTIAVFNPTTQTLTVHSVTAYVPISFTYKLSSTSGMITANPFYYIADGKRVLSFSPGFSVPPRDRKTFSFGVVIAPGMALGRHAINVDTSTTIASVSRIVKITGVAPIDIPLGASSETSLGGGAVVTQGGTINIMLGRSGLAATNISVRVRITCPPGLQPCGTLRNVFVAQEVNGRGVTSFSLQPDVLFNVLGASGLRFPTNDYGFYKGLIPGTGVLPGVPFKLYPDWDPHRPCIAYDFIGFGIRPIGCVGGGDSLLTPQLYDPSGIVRDADTLQPIVGATATLFRLPFALPDTNSLTRNCRTVNTRPGGIWSGEGNGGEFEVPGFMPAQISPNVNPQTTGANGRYGWDVVTGCWYVVVSAPGYASKTSALVGVPPEVTDLDFLLTAVNLDKRVYLPVTIR